MALPKTKEYRVATLAVHYHEPVETIGPDGNAVVVFATKVGRFGEHILLTDAEAKRLDALGPLNPDGSRRPAVKGKDEPVSYDEMDDKQLKSLAEDRGLSVTGSGANGEALHTDLVAALHNYDQARTSL